MQNLRRQKRYQVKKYVQEVKNLDVSIEAVDEDLIALENELKMAKGIEYKQDNRMDLKCKYYHLFL